MNANYLKSDCENVNVWADFGKNGGFAIYVSYHLEELNMRMLAMLIMTNQYATQQRKTKRSIKKIEQIG